MPTAAVIAPDDTVLGHLTAGVESHLAKLLSSERERWLAVDTRFSEPLDLLAAFLLSGGKRLRPAFCTLGYLGAGGPGDDPALLDAAVALELLHTFALIHDDVMDGSSTRRRSQALHVRIADDHRLAGWRGDTRRFGEGVAVLTGDLAFAWAQRLISRVRPEARSVWHDLTAELMMGQYLDVTGAARGDIDLERALRIARYKSGAYTVERPLQIGAALAGRLADLAATYSAFGRPVGEAFQLRDDLLGVFGDTRTGKPVGDDLREGKPTVLLALARRRCGSRSQALLDRVGQPDLTEHEIARLRRLFVECGARQEVEAMIAGCHTAALTALESAPISGHVRAAMADLAGRSMWRAA